MRGLILPMAKDQWGLSVSSLPPSQAKMLGVPYRL